jgi:hypothetical protein
MSRWHRTWFRIRLEAARRTWAGFVLKGLLLPAVLGATALAALLVRNMPVAAFLGGTLTAVLTATATIGSAWGALSAPFKKAIDSYASKPQYEQQLGFTSEADHQVAELTSVLTDDGHALVVFVDDLDRCSPRSLVDVVEAINQIFNSVADRPCVFVLGMDNEVVSSAIDVAYKETVQHLERRGSPLARGFGLNFLAKIVQVAVTVPAPTDTAMKRLLRRVTGRDAADEAAVEPHEVEKVAALLREGGLANPGDVATAAAGLERQLDEQHRRALPTAIRRVRGSLLNADSPDVATVEEELIAFLEPNPRQLKRFDNAFRLQLRVASDSDSSLEFERDELRALGKWVVLRLRWPDLAQAIDADPSLLQRLEAYANGDPAADDGVAAWFEGRALQPLLEAPPEQRLARVRTTFVQIA